MSWNNPQQASRSHMKMERIARLELAGYTDEEIAVTIGITKVYVSMLRRTPAYVAIRIEVASGILSETNRLMLQDQEAMLEQLKQMAPNALLVIRNVLLSPTTPMKLRLDAAREVLDREGTFVKVSKSEIKKTEIYKLDENDLIANNLLEALRQNAIKSTGSSSPDQSNGFDDFTNTDLNKDQKTMIQEGMNLKEMSSQSKSVN